VAPRDGRGVGKGRKEREKGERERGGREEIDKVMIIG
jgi:hypothetical protein